MNTGKGIYPVFLFLFIVLMAATGCNNSDEKEASVKPTFKKVWGKQYTEVKRLLESGLSFDNYGYQQEPQWRMSFVNDDSASVYSPRQDKFFFFPVTFDHDSIINVARTWMRIKEVTPDSLVFLVLKVEGTTIYLNAGKLYMTFYADDYIKNKLHTTAEALKRPSAADTAHIRKMASYVNTHPDTAFAARQPVVLTSKSPLVRVEKAEKPLIDTSKFSAAKNNDDYFNPEYNITINNAYDDFYYSFYVYADQNGGMRYGDTMLYIEDFKEEKVKIMKAIIDGYLKAYVNVTPGSTLGIPHTSTVILNVKGTK